MVFSSLSFILIFLPCVLFIYYFVPRKYRKIRNLVLLLFSLLFYFIGEQKLVLLMLLSCLVNYLITRLMNNRNKKVLLIISIIFNLGMLGYFKYADFFIDNFNKLLLTNINLLKIVLPIGISFYTFQTMSYVIDVYKGKLLAEKSLIDFSLFVTFFPQLIAGPIVRFIEIQKEIKVRTESIGLFHDGVQRFIIGLSKKVLISNVIAEVVSFYPTMNYHTTLFAWLVAIMIPLQIYFDFSGYSDMAIGLGKMFGFNFPENFKFPFASSSVTEFWRRWHITLGTWFRDYVYIPLGGNKVIFVKHIINILIVWTLTGLWHGASWNFVIWGVYYGLLLTLEKYIYGNFLKTHIVISHIYLILATIIGFEIFNSTNLNELVLNISELFGRNVVGFTSILTNYNIKSYFIILVIAVIGSTPVIKNILSKLKEKNNILINITGDIICIVLLILSIAYLVDGSYNPFLYFRF